MTDRPDPAPHPERGIVDGIARALQERLGDAPPLALVLGSGLGSLVDATDIQARAAHHTLGLPVSTVAGHRSEVAVGTLKGTPVALVSGRVHLYEGWEPAAVVRYVRALATWGVETLLLTNAAGGVSFDLSVGDLVALTDHINLTGRSPLVGPAYAERFPDPGAAYPARLRKALAEAAEAEGVPWREGVYAAMLGPAYETPAEVRMVRTMGADLVGMSTVPEVLAAVEVGLEVGAVSVVSNLAAGMSDESLDHEDVVASGKHAAARLATVLARALPTLVPSAG